MPTEPSGGTALKPVVGDHGIENGIRTPKAGGWRKMRSSRKLKNVVNSGRNKKRGNQSLGEKKKKKTTPGRK